MSPWEERSEELPLDERVVDYLAERPGRVAFNGLRRALSAHPESLTRTLRRLERHGVVRKGADGYGLVDPPAIPSAGPPLTTRSFAEVSLTPDVSATSVFGRLAGRWFGSLRWVGMYEPDDGPWLVWSVEGAKGQVRLGIRHGRLRVQLELASEGDPEGRVEEAARSLLRHALDAFEPEPTPTGGALGFGPKTGPIGFAA